MSDSRGGWSPTSSAQLRIVLCSSWVRCPTHPEYDVSQWLHWVLAVSQLKLLPLLGISCAVWPAWLYFSSWQLLTPALSLLHTPLFFAAPYLACPVWNMFLWFLCFLLRLCHWCCHSAWLIKWTLLHAPSAWLSNHTNNASPVSSKTSLDLETGTHFVLNAGEVVWWVTLVPVPGLRWCLQEKPDCSQRRAFHYLPPKTAVAFTQFADGTLEPG